MRCIVPVCDALPLSACAQRNYVSRCEVRHLAKPGTYCDIDFVCHSDFTSASASSSVPASACMFDRYMHHTDVCRINDECRMQLTCANFVALSSVKRRTFRLSNGKLLSFRVKLGNFRSIFITVSHTHIHLQDSCVIQRRLNQTNINFVFRFNAMCHRRWYRWFILLFSVNGKH